MDTTKADRKAYLDAMGKPLLRFRLGGTDMGWLVIGSNDWSAWQYPSHDIRVRIERTADLGRFQITGLALLSSRDSLFGPAPITVTELRDIPLVRLDAFLNDPRLSEALPAAIEHAKKRGKDLSPTGGVEGEEIPTGEAVPAPGVNYKIVGASNTKSRPNEFYRAVGQAWSVAVAEGHRNPAMVIATANEVTVTTVHRWVREARRRKVMAPSSREGDPTS